MRLPIRSILALSVLVVILAACGTAAGAPTASPPSPTAPAEPSAEPTIAPSEAPSEAPQEPRDVAGTITIFEGSISGPGGSIEEVLALGNSDEYPTLANGVLFRDTDGTIYLATSISDITGPTFEGPMLEVLNMPNDGPSWDMANADLIGIEEVNGFVFRQNAQVGGYLVVN